MPRYCLFGDAMNSACRMECHGQANTCQRMSEECGWRNYSQITMGKKMIEIFWLQPATLDHIVTVHTHCK
ncbi:hypothetical protein BV898_00393 [Hypsibius exemplaris]|uniref:Guanylate cyclase domain-containing protein n=1 Tax=Hypsibius exemplaris TaxID=2072580 RepID=A0A1W0XDK0_HYPEX|nr:hypothetical protein BV898_00393 [Hypsibius exemplaris]